MEKLLLLFVLSLLCVSLNATPDTLTDKRIYNISKLTGVPPVIDGLFDDPAWDKAEWQSDFVQHMPYEGIAPSFQTKMALCFDENYIYVAIEALDSNPDSIVYRISRRDDIDGDFVFIDFDSYFDLRTCFAFMVSAGGSKADFIISNNGQSEDETWDPVWWVKTSVNAKGWLAEMKIPFSQLRFDNSQTGIWGLDVGRQIYRYDEMSMWQNIPRDAPGFIHLFGELHGLKNVKPRKQAEIVPYATSGLKKYEPEAGNPFQDGSDFVFNTGLDAKIGLTNNLTLDLSINPDFGQVEADPSEVNLTEYESFFEEKRPLFIEGKNIYNFPLMFGDGGIGSENIFYSRRIGRRPHYEPELPDGQYIKMPEQTNILAAAKLSGKTSGGTSIGILETIAVEEFATIDNNLIQREESVEPLTNYFVGRVLQDMNDGNTILGGIFTSTYRSIKDEHLSFLPVASTTGGIDFQQYWSNRGYNIKFVNYYSQVEGSEEAISDLQRSSARFYQRPDAEYISLDTSRTSLSGFGGNFQFWKTSGKLNLLAAVTWKSPGLELNDIGFLRSADEILQVLWAGYNIYEPFSIFRRVHFDMNQYMIWDFGGNKQLLGFEGGTHASFKNLWSAYISFGLDGKKRFNSFLRGGPAMLMPADYSLGIGFETNDTKKFIFSPGFRIARGFEKNMSRESYSLEFDYLPSDRIAISVEPELMFSYNELQYVDQSESNDEFRYIFGSINQRILSMSIRLNFSITPDLTIQYWGQPFLASGDYYDFKRITNSKAEEYFDRFELFKEGEISLTEDEYSITENGSAFPEYSFSNPDFNIKELLSNLVLRWEYQPGSVVYLIWSQNRAGCEQSGEFGLEKDLADMMDITPTNIFLLKFSYRLGR